jgi:hypothetical protein
VPVPSLQHDGGHTDDIGTALHERHARQQRDSLGSRSAVLAVCVSVTSILQPCHFPKKHGSHRSTAATGGNEQGWLHDEGVAVKERLAPCHHVVFQRRPRAVVEPSGDRGQRGAVHVLPEELGRRRNP